MQGNLGRKESRRNPHVHFAGRRQPTSTSTRTTFEEQTEEHDGSDCPAYDEKSGGDRSPQRRAATNFSEFETCPMLEIVNNMSEPQLSPALYRQDRIPALGKREHPPSQQLTRTARKARGRSGGRRCVHYHAHYHTHHDSNARQETICAKATRFATSWWHKSHRHGGSYQSRPCKGPDDHYAIRSAARCADSSPRMDSAYSDDFPNSTSEQHYFSERQGRYRPRPRTSYRHSVQYYPWLHPYRRAGKVYGNSTITYR